MPTQNLTAEWTAPTSGAEVASYTVQGRKGTTGTFVDLATGVSPASSDPQTHTVPKADVDSNLNNPADGDTIQARIVAVGTAGSTSQPSPTGQTTVPAAVTTAGMKADTRKSAS